MSESKDNRVTAALAYVFILFVIPWMKADNGFCRFHARQGMVLFIAWILASFIAWIPVVGWVGWLAMLIVNVIAIVKTLDGQMWEIPYLGKFAKRINW
jgi:uncharacterized membrane protein